MKHKYAILSTQKLTEQQKERLLSAIRLEEQRELQKQKNPLKRPRKCDRIEL